jgi:hypothetical protein
MREELSDNELLTIALGHIGESLCALYETKGKEYQALAFMVDSCVKLGTVLLNEDDILSASADYTAYENSLGKPNLKVIK